MSTDGMVVEDVETEQSQTLGAFAAALALAQSEMDNASKDSVNPHFKSKYADLAGVRNSCTPALTKNKIATVQQVLTRGDGAVGVRTILIHASGEFMGSRAWCKPAQPGPQPMGSVITYLRRYMLAAAVGIAQEDDDGNSAQQRPPERHEPRDPKAAPVGVRSAGPAASSAAPVHEPPAFPRVTMAQAKQLSEALSALLPDALPAARAEYVAWAIGRKPQSAGDLNTAEATLLLEKIKRGEVPSGAETQP